MKNKSTGFTLIELLLTLAIGIIIAVIGISSFAYFLSQKNFQTTGEQLVATARDAQNKSISGEKGLQWGIHFENSSSGPSFFDTFSGTSYSFAGAVSPTVLSSGMKFVNPASQKSKDAFFSKIDGKLVADNNEIISFTDNSNNHNNVGDIIINKTGRTTYYQESGLVGYWHFDEGSSNNNTVMDSSGWGNDGSLGKQTWLWSPLAYCVSDNCLFFKNNYINVSAVNSSLNLNSSFTLSAWISDPYYLSGYETIIYKQSSVGYSYMLRTNGREISSGIGTASVDSEHITNGANLQLSKWYNVVSVFDSVAHTFKIYLNGNAILSEAENGSLYSDSNRLFMGKNSSGGEAWYGYMDEVKIYNRVLSPDEILNNYNILAPYAPVNVPDL